MSVRCLCGGSVSRPATVRRRPRSPRFALLQIQTHQPLQPELFQWAIDLRHRNAQVEHRREKHVSGKSPSGSRCEATEQLQLSSPQTRGLVQQGLNPLIEMAAALTQGLFNLPARAALLPLRRLNVMAG